MLKWQVLWKDDMKCLTYILFFHVSLKSPSNMFMKNIISFADKVLDFLLSYISELFSQNKCRKPPETFEVVWGNFSFWGGGGGEIPEQSYQLKIDGSSQKAVFCEQWWLYQRALLANITENCIYPSTLNNE